MKASSRILLHCGYLLGTVLLASRSDGATVGHWRFEAGAFLEDSSANGFDLSGSPALATDLSSVNFPPIIAATGQNNTGYADFSGGTSDLVRADASAFHQTTAFTLEAILRYSGNGNLQNVIAQWADGAGASNRGFRFGVNAAGKINLGLYHGSTVNIDSDFSLTSGKSYFIAAVFEDSGAQATVRLYARNLTDGGEVLDYEATVNFGQLSDSPLALSIGSYDGADKPWTAALDEVRFSDAALAVDDFLIGADLPSNPLEAWRQLTFGTIEGTGDAADTADPDADTWVNLLEFLGGSEALDPASVPDWSITGNGTDAVFSIEIAKNAYPMRYRITASPDLGEWDREINPSLSTLDDGRVTQAYPVAPESIDTAKQFARLELTPSFPPTSMNPIVNEGSADPSARVFGDRLYIYPSHDFDASNTEFTMYDWKCYSTDDLVNWRDEGVILTGSDVSWCDLPSRCYAPDAIERNGIYYFYFCFVQEQGEIGVATSTSPAGPFVDAIDEPLIDDSVIAGQHIDPGVFIDDDGQAYIVWGGQFQCFIAKLKDNMIELDGPAVELTTAINQNATTFYAEGSWLHKRDGIYYLSYHDTAVKETWGQTRGVAYAMNRTGDLLNPSAWEYEGVLMGDYYEGSGHHSINRFKGRWLMFYHRHDGNRFYRKASVEYLFYRPDGTMVEVVPTEEGVGSL